MKPKWKHPYKEVEIDGKKVTIDEKIVNLIVAINEMGWTTTQSCQNNIKGRVWIGFSNANDANHFLNCIASRALSRKSKLTGCVIASTTQSYDEEKHKWTWRDRWWVDAFTSTLSWKSIEIHISVRFPKKHLKEVTKIMKRVAKEKRMRDAIQTRS